MTTTLMRHETSARRTRSTADGSPRGVRANRAGDAGGADAHPPQPTAPKRIRCSQVWGGTQSVDLDVRTAGLCASIHSAALGGSSGGDMYYFSVCDGDLLTRVVVADVTGHGEAVSLLSQWMYDALVERMNSLDGNGVLTDLNRLACEHGIEAMTTASVVGFYRAQSRLFLSCAGHPPLLVRRAGERRWWEARLTERTDAANLPLGVLPGADYDQRCFPLSAGDRVFLYTDGVLETPDSRGDQFGAARLLDVLNRCAARTPAEQKRAVLEALREHGDGEPAQDDVTLVAMELT